MLGAAWFGAEGSRLAARLAGLLYEAARSDPLLEAITGDARHCHGYGYLLVYSDGRGWRILWERYDAADELGPGEESCRANLDALGWAAERLASLVEGTARGVLMLHARRASRGEPRGSLHAHPYLHGIPGRNGYRMLALMHNGSVHKDGLALLLGVDPAAYTDTHLLAVWLARQLGTGRTMEEAVREAEKYTKTALDIVLADIAPGPSISLYIYSHLPEGLDANRLEYYKPVVFTAGEAKGYMSSTLKLLAEKRGLKLETDETIGKLYHVKVTG
ncbi:hypothetical protein [Hyperthermus butylicus]|uniref:Glutamine amidotransferase type-2 domain-containing protein n=1 Tax=Hyperthermus butylicus (strain DSM 5456 / JCM 9403 / PLM1-5) TaxID=415426 RepID=A2BKU3_HYPBU|nr:hypothetical protein [Hyperthermus butylicus]ABM80604.1 hypothetical protein Hbut_0750 [Hyperthermus butylicus DSM 5456]